MEKFEFKRLGVELTSEDFSLNVNTTTADAGYSPIVEGFYTTALVVKLI